MRPHFLADHRLLPHRRRAAAEFLGPGKAQEVALGQQATERLRGLEVGRVVGERAQKVFGHIVVHQLTQLTAQRVGFLPHLEVHGLSRSRCFQVGEPELAEHVIGVFAQ